MKGFLLGLLCAAVALGGYLYWKSLPQGHAPQTKVTADAGPTAAKKKRKRSRGATRLARARADVQGGGDPGGAAVAREPEPDPEPAAPVIRLSAADKRIVGQGDDLSRPDILRLDMGDDKGLPELTQDEIDSRFRGQEERLLDCISHARPDSEAYVPGLVTVKFRIQRAGTVRGVRVDAPAILQKGGLYACVKGVVEKIKFPASSNSQIVSYPFQLS